VKATDTAGATAAFPKLQKVIDTLSKKNIIHKNNAARKKSRFAGMLAALSPSQK